MASGRSGEREGQALPSVFDGGYVFLDLLTGRPITNLSNRIASRVIIYPRGAIDKMRSKVLLSIVFSCIFVHLVDAQPVRTVTNADLEKFRLERLKAEKEYRENYERLGFPSPEELQRQIELSRVEQEVLSTRLAAERIRQEQAAAERARREELADPVIYIVSGKLSAGQSVYWFNDRRIVRTIYPRVRQFSPNVRIGNGIPVVDYYQNQRFGPSLPAFNVPGRRVFR